MKANGIKAIIIDDESAARNVLERLLVREFPDIQILDKCGDLESGVAKIKGLQPDLVFLDVQMPNYAGYEIVNFFDQLDFEIIFVTAYDQYAIKAFELNAIDYLVKPIKRSRLSEAIAKFNDKQQHLRYKDEYELLMQSMKKKEFNKIIIPELGNRRILDIEQIVAIEADGAYSKIHLNNNEVLILSKNLKYFESTLPENAGFFRTHRTWLINLNYIEHVNKGDMTVTLGAINCVARLSRNRLKEFEAVFSS